MTQEMRTSYCFLTWPFAGHFRLDHHLCRIKSPIFFLFYGFNKKKKGLLTVDWWFRSTRMLHYFLTRKEIPIKMKLILILECMRSLYSWRRKKILLGAAEDSRIHVNECKDLFMFYKIMQSKTNLPKPGYWKYLKILKLFSPWPNWRQISRFLGLTFRTITS